MRLRLRVSGLCPRRQPFSRIPHFNRDVLAAVLKTRGISYVLLGRELGARREEQDWYVNGQAVYERVGVSNDK
ncbi:MAG: DUF488 family protein [Phycisphaerae bacterium]|nr:DUF488 family protein [Phycisphaerae bacterium]